MKVLQKYLKLVTWLKKIVLAASQGFEYWISYWFVLSEYVFGIELKYSLGFSGGYWN